MCSHINALTAFPGPNGRTQVKNPYERNPLKLPDLAPNRDRELSPISPEDIWHEPLDGSEPEIERLKRLGSNSVAFEETEETRPGKWLHITGCDGFILVAARKGGWTPNRA